ncbi:Uncharacterized membrane protein YkvA, DUF1232 family [Desulfatibacillum alkenivorans DSM 16219]|uniref:Uncharacterized membrane protein YkvA, DUF1232 family n=1 Tax=Desulfatibacillum alkenivorans DSM 16219 TaxID=1121393 RepID=A0A1M6UHF5_9BACT|nr:Uncharacterized membrane protein YkvA, DUF1232 family [Desulfatibacillum alkenivorans DSM 16219]
MNTENNALPQEKIQKISDSFSKSQAKAEKIINDKQKAQKVVNEAIKKAKKLRGPLGKVWDDLQAMFGIVIDWITGDYREVPLGSIILIMAALLYFLSPIDVIPDFIPVVGYIDDVFVLGLAIAQVHSDLEKYQEWKEGQL